MFRVKAIQVEHGDSLLVSYGHPEQPRHLLVDGGPSGSRRVLVEVLQSQCVGGKLLLEALVITHYDLDHINGVIELLGDLPTWLEIGDVWFNGRQHMPDTDNLGSAQGDQLKLIIERLSLKWNGQYPAEAGRPRSADEVRAAAIQQSSCIAPLEGGLVVKVLSPDPAALKAVAQAWVGSDPPSDASRPGDELGRQDKWPPNAFRSYLKRSAADDSIPNRSSIALMLEFEGKRVILAADAYAKVIKDGLSQHLPDGGSVNLLKVSHHGSKRNTDSELLTSIACTKFLITTSGSVHMHPDHAMIARLVLGGNSTLVFNYGSDKWPGKWINHPGNGWPQYEVEYPNDGDRFVDVML